MTAPEDRSGEAQGARLREHQGAECPRCGTAGIPIRYGYPSPEMFSGADRGEIVLGGCCIPPDRPGLACPKCHWQWRGSEGAGAMTGLSAYVPRRRPAR